MFNRGDNLIEQSNNQNKRDILSHCKNVHNDVCDKSAGVFQFDPSKYDVIFQSNLDGDEEIMVQSSQVTSPNYHAYIQPHKRLKEENLALIKADKNNTLMLHAPGTCCLHPTSS